MLQDIAILTGGEVITGDLGLELKDTRIDQLGKMCIRDRYSSNHNDYNSYFRNYIWNKSKKD